jgi:RHS repeat-associated protein
MSSNHQYFRSFFALLLAIISISSAQVEVQSRDETYGDQSWLKQRVVVENLGSETLVNYTIRFFVTAENNKVPESIVWDPHNHPYNRINLGNGVYAFDFNMSTYPLNPGQKLKWGNGIAFGIRFPDYSPWDATNDFSYTNSTQFSITQSIQILDYNGDIIYGNSPVTSSSSSSQLSSVAVSSSSAISSSLQSSSSSSVPNPIEVQVRIRAKDEGFWESNYTKPRIVVDNYGTETLSNYKIRYYFTTEYGLDPIVERWDPTNIPYEQVSLGLDAYYLEFDMSAYPVHGGQQLRWGNGIHFGIHYSNYSTWDVYNDFSRPYTNSYQDNDRIQIIDQNGVVIYGNAPGTISSSSSSISSSYISSSSSISSSSEPSSSSAFSSSLESSSSVIISSSTSLSSSVSSSSSLSSSAISSSSAVLSSSSISSSSQLSSSSVILSSSSFFEDNATVTGNVAFPGAPIEYEVPADPIAPEITSEKPAGSFADQFSFLFDPVNGVITGLNIGILSDSLVTVLRGKTKFEDGAPMAGVKVSIKGESGYGYTISRENGEWDLLVNASSSLVVTFEKWGHLPVDRRVKFLKANGYSSVETVILTELSPVASIVDMSSIDVITEAEAISYSDEDGERTSRLLIPEGTQVSMITNGSVTNLSQITVRMTEYTVGSAGPSKMPAALPSNTAYTYAMEFSIDEAILAGADQVTFSKPLINYLENFMNFPVGTVVPVGYYDRVNSEWVASLDGLTIQIVGIENSRALLDLDGDGYSDNNTFKSNILGITDGELIKLAQNYGVGQSLWRVAITHFTPYDYNYPFAPDIPDDVVTNPPPPPEPPEPTDPIEDPVDPDDPNQPEPEEPETEAEPPEPEESDADVDGEEDGTDADPCAQGSIIDVNRCTVAEAVPVAGTPFNLVYNTRNAKGFEDNRKFRVRVRSKNTLPAAGDIIVRVTLAGKTVEEKLPGHTEFYEYHWNGKDAYGREKPGYTNATVEVAYEYPLVYQATAADFSSSWNSFSFGNGIGQSMLNVDRNAAKVEFSKIGEFTLFNPSKTQIGIKNWSLDVQSEYFPYDKLLRKGAGGVEYFTQNLINGQARDISTWGSGFFVFPWMFDAHSMAPYQGDSVFWKTSNTRILLSDFNNSAVKYYNAPSQITSDVYYGINKYIYHSFGQGILKVQIEGDVYNWVWSFYPSTISGNYQYIRLDKNENTWFTLDNAPTTIYKVTSYDTYSSQSIPVEPLQVLNDFGVLSDGKVILIYDTEIYSLLPDGAIISLFSAKDGETFKSIAIDEYDRIYVGYNRGGEGFISILSQKGSMLPYVGGGGVFPTRQGIDAAEIKIGNLMNVRVNWRGDLLYSDNRANLKNVVTITGFSNTFGFNDHQMVIASDGYQLYNSKGLHKFTISKGFGDTLLTFNYDENDLLSEIIEANNRITTIHRDVNNNITSFETSTGFQTELSYDASNRISSISRSTDSKWLITYFENDLIESFTDPEGYSSTFEYSETGRMIKDTDARGGFKTLIKNDNIDTLKVITSTAEGRENISYRYTDKYDRPIYANKSAWGGFSFSMFDDELNVVKKSESGMRTTIYRSDDLRFGKDSKRTDSIIVESPSGISSVSYFGRDEIWDIQNPSILLSKADTIVSNGRTYISEYDGLLRKRTTTSPSGLTSVVFYDSVGQVIKKEQPGVDPIFFTYDTAGQVIEIEQSGYTQTFEYNDKYQLSAVVNALGEQNEITYDNLGRPISKTFDDGSSVSMTYNKRSDVTSVTTPHGAEHIFWTNPVGLDSLYNSPNVSGNTGSVKKEYNLDKQLVKATWEDGQTLTNTFLDDGRLSIVTTSLDAIQVQYLQNSAQIDRYIRESNGTQEIINYDYDGSLVSQVSFAGSNTGSIQYSYGSGMRLNQTTFNGTNISYGYNADNKPTQIGDLTLGYDPSTGRLISSQVGSVSDSRTYNNRGLPSSKVVTAAGGTIASWNYNFDPLGRIKTITEQDGNLFEYFYDNRGRLAQVHKNGLLTSDYTYDNNGNRLTHNGTEATYNSQDQILTYDSKSFTWDQNGFLKTMSEGGQITTYNYDIQHNLRSVELPNGEQVEYIIDARNRRIGKKVNGIQTEGFLYKDQLNPYAWMDGSGNEKAIFIYGEMTHVPSYMIKSGIKYKYVTDHLGSVRALVNTSTGTLAQSITYDEFGNQLSNTNPDFQPFGYVGGITDYDTDLIRFGARDYDPSIGRWTSKEPLGFGGALNWYVYVGNDPVNKVDPSGLVPEWLVPKYGNYCGPGRSGDGFIETPIDDLDMCCKQHDQCYVDNNLKYTGNDKTKEQVVCDSELYICSSELDPDPNEWDNPPPDRSFFLDEDKKAAEYKWLTDKWFKEDWESCQDEN